MMSASSCDPVSEDPVNLSRQPEGSTAGPEPSTRRNDHAPREATASAESVHDDDSGNGKSGSSDSAVPGLKVPPPFPMSGAGVGCATPPSVPDSISHKGAATAGASAAQQAEEVRHFAHLKAAMALGNTDAWRQYAVCLLHGRGCDADPEEGRAELLECAEGGDVLAMLAYGEAALQGMGGGGGWGGGLCVAVNGG